MISEFQDLSDKIERLAQLTGSLRAENHLLRQANQLLSGANAALEDRLAQAQTRVEALLEHFPAPETSEGGADAAREATQ
jgi:cell division protein ZapB